MLLIWLMWSSRCKHSYTLTETIDVYDTSKNSNTPHTKVYLYMCEKCGKIKKTKVSAIR